MDQNSCHLDPCLVPFNQFINNVFLYFLWMGGRLMWINFYPKFRIFRLRCEDSVRLICSSLRSHRRYQYNAMLAMVEVISDDHLVPITLERLLGFRYQNCLVSFELEEICWSHDGVKK